MAGARTRIDAPLQLGNDDLQATVNPNATLEINGVVASGAGRLTLTGGGTLELNSASGHTRGTTVSNGTFQVRSGGSLVGTGNVGVESGGTLAVIKGAGADPVMHSVSPNSVVLNGGALRIGADLDVAIFLDSTSADSGIQLDQITFTGGGTNVLDLATIPGGDHVLLGASRTSTIASGVMLKPDDTTHTLRFGRGTAPLIVDAVLADVGATPTHLEHVGGTTNLRAANTYTGDTTVRSGILEVNHSQALGSPPPAPA